MIVVVAGLPGSGKTYFAKVLASRLGFAHVNSDHVRNEVGVRGKYSFEEKKNVYEIMSARARQHLIAGDGTVVDATFYQQSMVNIFSSLSKEMSVPIHFIYIDADEQLVRRRLMMPRKDSEADFNVYKKIKSQFEPLTVPHITITSGEDNVEEMISIALKYISNRQ